MLTPHISDAGGACCGRYPVSGQNIQWAAIIFVGLSFLAWAVVDIVLRGREAGRGRRSRGCRNMKSTHQTARERIHGKFRY